MANQFTTKEVLNKVLLDSSGNAITANSVTSQQALNAVLDTSNNRLNVSLGGSNTISGDVTITGDLTVQGNGTGNYDEIVQGNLEISETLRLNPTISSGSKTTLAFMRSDNNKWRFIQPHDDSYLKLYNDSASATQMYFASNNSIGIATNSPVAQGLTLANDGDVNLTLLADSDANADNNWPMIDFRVDNTSGNPEARIYYKQSDTSLILATANTSALTIDSSQNITLSGNVGIGITTMESAGGGVSQLQVEGTTHETSSISITRNANSANAGYLTFSKSRGTSVNSDTIVQDDDAIGSILFAPADGTDRNSISASILGAIDGTPGSNDVPGRLVFSTASDGANSVTERMRIDSSGHVLIGTSSASDQAVQLYIHEDDSAVGNTGIHIENAKSDDAAVLILEGARTSTNDTAQVLFRNSDDSVARIVCFSGHGSNNDSGELRFDVSADGTASSISTAMTIDTAGRLGLGITPEAWTVFTPLQISTSAVLTGRPGTNQLDLANNWYYDGAEKRINAGYVVRYTQTSAGGHEFYTAGTDSADSTISFGTAKLAISNSGTATFAGDVKISKASGSTTQSFVPATGQSSQIQFFQDDGTTQDARIFAPEGAQDLAFEAGTTEVLRLDTNSRISLSNNDNGTGGVDSSSANTIFGYLSGANIASEAHSNVLIGHKAGNAMVGGRENVAIGTNALDADQYGEYSIAIGSNALGAQNDSSNSADDGMSNIGIGRMAGNVISNGQYNICIGESSGGTGTNDLTTGDKNVLIGRLSGSGNANAQNRIAIGHEVTGNQNYGTVIGNKGMFQFASKEYQAHQADGEDLKSASAGEGLKLPAYSIIKSISVVVTQLSNLGTFNICLVLADESVGIGDNTAFTNPVEVLGAGVAATLSGNSSSAVDIALGSGAILKQSYHMDEAINVGASDKYLHVAQAGTGNGDTNPSTNGLLNVMVEYIGLD